MDTDNKRDYGQEAPNSPEQKLSYFENHIDKYPGGPKSTEETNKDNLMPDPEDFDEGDYEDAEDKTILDRNAPDSPEDGRDKNITPDSNSYNPKSSNSSDKGGRSGPGAIDSGTNPDRYTK